MYSANTIPILFNTLIITSHPSVSSPLTPIVSYIALLWSSDNTRGYCRGHIKQPSQLDIYGK